MRLFFLIALFATVAACAEDGSLGREGSTYWFNHTPPQEIVAHYEGICRSYGFNPGTEAMAHCISSEIQTAKGGNSVKAVNSQIAYNNTYRAVVGY